MNIETTHATAKDFFLYAGWIITLYASIISLLTFVFSCINLLYPPLYFSPSFENSGIVTAISVLIVMFPAFIILSKIIYKDIDKNKVKKDIWIRRWSLYLTIFALGLTLAVTVITLINAFLNGDFVANFALKVVATLLVAGGSIIFYIQDSKGVFIGKKKVRNIISIIVSVLVALAVIGGVIIVGTPGERRAQEFDNQRVSDLSSIQSSVLEYWRTQEKLPANMAELKDPLSYFVEPLDPQTGMQYQYTATGEYSFELCAEFETESMSQNQDEFTTGKYSSAPTYKYDLINSDWQHGAGKHCFERTIDPKRFPTYDN
jgi:hypothetical protein